VKENTHGIQSVIPKFGVLNKAQSELQKIGCCPLCERLLDSLEEESEAEKEEEEKTD
jgi:hypothetical protein